MKRTRIRPVSSKRRRRDAPYPKARQAVYERSEGLCEARAVTGCTGRCEQVHHIAGRGGPDPHRLDNLLGVCLVCHQWIEANRYEAESLGFRRSKIGE